MKVLSCDERHELRLGAFCVTCHFWITSSCTGQDARILWTRNLIPPAKVNSSRNLQEQEIVPVHDSDVPLLVLYSGGMITTVLALIQLNCSALPSRAFQGNLNQQTFSYLGSGGYSRACHCRLHGPCVRGCATSEVPNGATSEKMVCGGTEAQSSAVEQRCFLSPQSLPHHHPMFL
ncbi:hypothetical protein FPV67DRAFT_1481916 [Lyophyllum atratum]|nr:hypothetical protein FPV67DRAFT_1481916 [Lyophyllum atratum]